MTAPGDVAPVLVDTSVLIDHLRGRSEARDVLVNARSVGRRVCSSVVVRTEILGGMRSSERRRTLALIDAIEWIEVDTLIADRAGELARAHHRANPGIDLADYVVAATTEIYGADLKTRNIKHFPMFPSLTAPY